MADLSLTAVVLTRNEEARIRRCLQHLSWVDEILVVDSGSRDGTVEICRAWPKTRVLQRTFDDFATQRNAGIDAARGAWILVVDADEEVPAALAEEIRAALLGAWDHYWIRRTNIVFGRPLRFGACQGDAQVRLFRKSHGRYVGAIHETLVVQGPSGQLRTPLRHRSYETVSEYVAKMDRYTGMEAATFVTQGRRGSWSRLLLGPWLRFSWVYVLRQGWRDGWVGFLDAAFGAFYFFLKHLKHRERLRGAAVPLPRHPASAP